MKRGYLKTYGKIIILICILIAIFYMVAYFVKSEYKNEEFETIKTDMLLIEAKTEQIAQKVKMKEKEATYIGRKIENTEEIEEIKTLQEQGIINLETKNAKYYILTKEDLETLELNTITLKQGNYIVEYNTNEIIYTKGIQDKNGSIVYTLSEMK